MEKTFKLSEEIENEMLINYQIGLRGYRENLDTVVRDIKNRMQPGQGFVLTHDRMSPDGGERQIIREAYYAFKKKLHAAFNDNGTQYHVQISESADQISISVSRRVQEDLVSKTIRAGAVA